MTTNTRTLGILLGGLALLGPLSVDAYLPAFDSIRDSLHTGPQQVKFTLSAYLFSYAVMSLWHGAISDALGRRKVILASLLVFAVASIGSALSPDVAWLTAFRTLQGVAAGAGTVVGRAMVRDLFEGSKAARMLSLVSMIFSLSPALAPVLGGWIITSFQWRAIFVFLSVYTVLLFVYCYRYLPESLPANQRQPLQALSMARNYWAVFRSRDFQRGAASIAFNFGGLFLFVAAAPAIVGHHLQLDVSQFGWQFGPMVAGIFLGSLAADRLAEKLSLRWQIAAGYILLLGASIANVAYHAVLPPALPWSVTPIFFYGFGMSLAAPGLTLMVLDLFPKTRGVAASMQAFSMVMVAAVVTAFLSPMLEGSMLWLAAGQLILGVLGVLAWGPSILKTVSVSASS